MGAFYEWPSEAKLECILHVSAKNLYDQRRIGISQIFIDAAFTEIRMNSADWETKRRK